MQQKTIQFIGWYGVVAIVLAYVLLSFDVISSTNAVYQLFNLTGAVAIAFEAWSKRDRQPAVLNIIWAIVALMALLRIWVS